MAYYVCFEAPTDPYDRDSTERHLVSFATADLVVTVILTLLCLCSSGLWADGVHKLKGEIEDPCHGCKVTNKPNYAGLIISVLFGFLSFFLWAGNTWFVYKETICHRGPGFARTEEMTFKFKGKAKAKGELSVGL
ncbi:synaptoporin-like [Dendronephthya gigantea]|uniref:synaptoporin-like n=1 Tax=Dendronephthya gigantea TaxID=151771 RepID=UPI001069A877|nr:synaptoporin-like [Dendronephthya gigantea]